MYHPHFRKKNNGVPVLSKIEIDEIAEVFILDYSPEMLDNPQPVNIDLFIEEYLGLTIDYHYLSNDGRFLGMTVFNDTSRIIEYLPEYNCADYCSASAGTIIIDTSLTENIQLNRYRYTGGHESGHWIFHRDYFNYDPDQLTFFGKDNPFVQCREHQRSYYSGVTRGWDDARWMEWQADKFSSCFLMPKTSVKKLLARKQLYRCNEITLIESISNTFQVSKEAAMYRLVDLGFVKESNNNAQLSFL